MAIETICVCGNAISAPDDLAGKTMQCGACGATVAIPQRFPGAPSSASPGGPVESGWKGSLSTARNYAEKIKSDALGGYSAAKQYAQAMLDAREARKRKAALQVDLQNYFEQLGTTAEQQGAGADLPAMEAVKSARQAIAGAEAAIQEKQSALQAAQKALDEEQGRRQAAIDALKAEYQPLSEAQKSAGAVLKEIQDRIRQAQAEINAMEQKKAAAAQGEAVAESPQEIESRIEQARQALAQAEGGLPAAQERADSARAAADAKAQEENQARDEWKEAKAKLDEDLRFARSAAESAEQDLKKARNALHEPLRAFGQAVAESSISHSAECAAFLEKIALARKEMADLDLEIEALAKTAEAKKGGAKRFALVWGTTALVVVVLLFLFLRSCFSGSGVSGNMSPAQTIETGARAISNGQPAAIWAMMPASYQKEIEGMVAGFANAMDEELWNKGLATLAKAQKTLEAKSGLIAESMGGALGAQSGMTSKQWQASLDQAAKVLKQALDSRIFELKSLKKPDIAEWIDDFAQKAAQDTVQKIRDGKLAAGPETKEMADVLKKLATVKATVKSAEGDAATVEVQFGDKTDTVELAKVDNRWIPKDMARGFPESMKANKAAIAALPEKVKQAKPQMMMMLGGIDGMLDAVSKAKTAEEMQAAVGGAMGMMGGMRMMGGMGGM